MALQETGVKLRADNEAGFLGAMTRASDAVGKFVKTAGTASTGMQPLSIGALAVANVIGNLASNVISSAISKITELGSSAVSAAADMQMLELSLQTLAARELVASGAVGDMNSALAQSGPIADDLLKKIRDLSIQSPFEYQDVVRVFQLNMAFGQTSETALELTRAITNIAAAMGGNGQIIERIAYNFSQMSLVGKVTARDIRDLAMAGFDLSRMLREELKMSVDEVNAALESGKITMQDVSAAFVSYADKNFGSAAERMSRTFKGLISSFKDLFFFSSIDLLGPSLDAVSKALGGVLDRAMAIVDSGALQKIGMVFGLLTEKALGAAGELGDALSRISDMILGSFSGTADSAMNWGTNIVQQLAIGIINGAKAALTAAMNFISSMLSSFLSPGSPPRVAPNIDKWGAAAMTQFLKGFTQADFNLLNAVQNPLKDVFSMMVSIGEMTEKKAGTIYANISKEIAKAITDGGKVSEKLFSDIAKSGGRWGKEIADLARKQIAYGVAVDAVKKAEEALKAARDKQARAQADVAKGIREYNAMLRGGASQKDLANKLKSINTSQKEADIQKAKGDAAQIELDKAKEKVDLLADQVKLQEELLKQLLEISRMQIIPKDEEKDGGKGGGGGGGGDKPPVPGGFGKGISDALDKLKKDLEDKLSHLFDPIVDAWNNMIAELTPKLKEIWDLLGRTWLDIQQRLRRIWDNIKYFWDQNGASIEATARRVVQTLTTQFGILTGQILKWLLEKLEQLSQWVVNNGPQIAKFIDGLGIIIEGLAIMVTSAWPTIQAILDLIIDLILNVASVILAVAVGDWPRAWEMLKKTAVDFANDIVKLSLEYLQNTIHLLGINWEIDLNKMSQTGTAWGVSFRAWWLSHWQQMLQMVNDKLFAIAGIIGESLKAMLAHLVSTITTMKIQWDIVWNAIKGIVARIFGQEVVRVIQTGANDIYKFIINALNQIRDFITKEITIWRGLGGNLIKGFAGGITSGIKAVTTAVSETVNNAIRTAKKILGIDSPSKIFSNIGKDMMQGFINGALSKAVELVGAIKKLISDAIAAAIAALKGGSPSRVFIGIGKDTMKGYQIGVKDETKDTMRTMTNSINAIIQPAQTSVPASASYSRTANLNLGGVNINNNTDDATLFAKFRQFLASEM